MLQVATEMNNDYLENVEVKIELALTSDTYQRSSPDAPQLIATTTITTANVDVLTIELRGEQDNGTILEEGFRMEHFTLRPHRRQRSHQQEPIPWHLRPTRGSVPVQCGGSPVFQAARDEAGSRGCQSLVRSCEAAREWTRVSHHAEATNGVVFCWEQRGAVWW